MITIFCLVHGEPATNAFPVEIDEKKTIGTLKKLIKSEKKNKFHDIDADELKLWSVSIPVDDTSALENLVLENNKERGVQELLPTDDIADVFSTPLKKHIHVIVVPPASTKEIHCTVTYGRNSATFQWTVTREATTLAGLKARFRRCFAFPDGTEDKDIDVSRETGKEKDRSIVLLLDDAELVAIVWVGVESRVDLSLIVDTSQRPFSSWDFAKMKPVFGLSADSFVELPTFEGGRVKITEHSDSIRHVLDDLMKKHKASPAIVSSNEATRCEFISSVIYGVVSCYDGQIKVYPQYNISGSHGKGPVDWAIKVGNTIIAITEAKKEDLDQGVGQNVIQLQASSQRNPKKRTYDSALREDVMFGIVTTGVEWVIIKLVSNGNNDNDNVQVLLSSRSPFSLPINEVPLQRERLKERLEDLFGQLVWAFDQQIESQGQPKRQRTL